jgi:hypothetical protein
MMRRTLSAGISLTAALAITAAAATTAAADDARCPANRVCMYEDPNYTGSLYVNQVYDGKKHEIDWWNGDNEISSIINNTGSSIKVYSGDGQGGSWQCVGAHAQRKNLEDNDFDNDAESWAFASC